MEFVQSASKDYAVKHISSFLKDGGGGAGVYIPNRHKDTDNQEVEQDSCEISFKVAPLGDDIAEVTFVIDDKKYNSLEEYLDYVSTIVSTAADYRASVIKALKEIQKSGRNINDLYSSKLIADKLSLRRFIFTDYASS